MDFFHYKAHKDHEEYVKIKNKLQENCFFGSFGVSFYKEIIFEAVL
jgi:hypothetical protein